MKDVGSGMIHGNAELRIYVGDSGSVNQRMTRRLRMTRQEDANEKGGKQSVE